MNREEFKTYLESIDGVYCWKGIKNINPDMFGVGEGWFGLLKNLIDELLSVGWDKCMTSSKEKFGGLNFYIKNLTKDMQDIIFKYEKLSYSTCEQCGDEGILRSGGWVKTLCDKHAEERKNKLK